jgi:hypothetical protein
MLDVGRWVLGVCCQINLDHDYDYEHEHEQEQEHEHEHEFVIRAFHIPSSFVIRASSFPPRPLSSVLSSPSSPQDEPAVAGLM